MHNRSRVPLRLVALHQFPARRHRIGSRTFVHRTAAIHDRVAMDVRAVGPACHVTSATTALPHRTSFCPGPAIPHRGKILPRCTANTPLLSRGPTSAPLRGGIASTAILNHSTASTRIPNHSPASTPLLRSVTSTPATPKPPAVVSRFGAGGFLHVR